MPGRLAGKRCLIVGGTSGIGLASALRFLEEGARLVVAGLKPPEAEAHTRLRGHGLLAWHACNAIEQAQVDEVVETSVRELGGLDIMFHVAGSSGRRHGDGPLHECTDEGWQVTLQANLTSVFLTNRAAIRRFRSQGQGGVILNLASVLPLSPAPMHFDTVAYTAAKGGVISLSRLAAASYAAEGIRVNVLAPGLIDTPMATRATQDPAIQAFLQTKQPLAHGPGRAEDLAEAAVFLCSDEARLITGAVLSVDGGWCVS
jgi:NAD(P)-dependent dehydrogenase (short-subunit alcohol dehydrogenase family)